MRVHLAYIQARLESLWNLCQSESGVNLFCHPLHWHVDYKLDARGASRTQHALHTVDECIRIYPTHRSLPRCVAKQHAGREGNAFSVLKAPSQGKCTTCVLAVVLHGRLWNWSHIHERNMNEERAPFTNARMNTFTVTFIKWKYSPFSSRFLKIWTSSWTLVHWTRSGNTVYTCPLCQDITYWPPVLYTKTSRHHILTTCPLYQDIRWSACVTTIGGIHWNIT